MTKLSLRASYDSRTRVLSCLNITTKLTVEEVAALPKWLRLRPGHYGYTIDFTTTKVQGDRNEAGLKRFTKLIELFPDFEWTAPAINSYKTVEDFKVAAGLSAPKKTYEDVCIDLGRQDLLED
jgi:hypothetical protein